MPYKVFIPTAGIGSRLGDLTSSINKSLVALDNKPIISHIINLFPRDAEFVIALGYKGEIVKEHENKPNGHIRVKDNMGRIWFVPKKILRKI